MSNTEKQIVIFRSDDGKISVDAHFDAETTWLSLDQMAELFDRDKSTVSRHIKNIFDEGELQRIQLLQKLQQLPPTGKPIKWSTTTWM